MRELRTATPTDTPTPPEAPTLVPSTLTLGTPFPTANSVSASPSTGLSEPPTSPPSLGPTIPRITDSPTLAPSAVASGEPTVATDSPSERVSSTPSVLPSATPTVGSEVIRTNDFYLEFLVLTNDEPTDEDVQKVIDFTNSHLTSFFRTNVTEYQVESFNCTLLNLTLTPSASEPPTMEQPASIRISFNPAVTLAPNSPNPTFSQVDDDMERAFETGTTFYSFLVMLLSQLRGTPFETTFEALWRTIFPER
jgi:hypothetical protein